MPITKLTLAVSPAVALALALAMVLAAPSPAHAHTKKALLTTRTSHHLRLSGYQTLSAARIGCGTGQVVWRTDHSKVFHTAHSRYFGKTRHGMYVCRRSALADHLHPAKD